MALFLRFTMSIGTSVPPFEVVLPTLTPSKAEREQQAFLRLLPVLLQTHAGRFVAIHEEKLVDHDADDIALVERVHRRFGYVPIHACGRTTK
jgi:hypothetical protein